MLLATLKRTYQHATTIPDLARARFARDEETRSRARRHVADKLGRLRGLPQKLGQIFSFSCGDETDASDFQSLQNQATPWPLEELIPVVEKAWGVTLKTFVESIDPHGFSASLGQVHRATLHDGRSVAIKIQYPDIREAVQADLRLLGWLGAPINSKRFDLEAYRATIQSNMNAELDYRVEAVRQNEMHAVAKGHPRIIVPAVITNLSTDQVLVSEWVSGDTWDNVRNAWSKDERRQLANSLVRFFIDGLLTHGRMQADWHPGNVQFDRRSNCPHWILYDFGGICHLSMEQRATLARLISATRYRSESPWPLFLKLGFHAGALAPMKHKLPALCQVLFEPFLTDNPFDVTQWKLGERVADILGEDRWNFRMAGPADLILLLRAMHGLSYYLSGLNAPVSWGSHLESSFDALQTEMDSIVFPKTDQDEDGFSQMSRWLKIRVKRDGKIVIELTQPASAVDRLDELMDDSLKGNIAQHDIDLRALIAGVRQRCFRPGPVFALRDGSKQIDVWLE